MRSVEIKPILDVLAAHRFRYADENQLQEGIAAALATAGFAAEREVRLNARDRIDLLVGRVGVEVKIAGSGEALLRQVRRYTESDLVDGIVVVTAKVRHLRLPTVLNGKPIEVLTVVGGGL
jgi:hypothetical protein